MAAAAPGAPSSAQPLGWASSGGPAPDRWTHDRRVRTTGRAD